MKDECYEFVKGPNNKVSIVGFGSYGEVKLARNTETGEIVAIKMIHGRNAKDEIDVHHKLNHPKIIRLLNYYYQKQKNMTYMVLEYAEGGTLHNKIKFGFGQLPKDKIKRYFRDICKAVQYLHSLKYMHRDIKPENILLTKDDHAKLCDFGFAAILEYRSTLCGTYEYMAPEMIQEKPYDYKVDIWALGILLFELIQGTAPFRGQNGQDVINQMKKPMVFSNRFEKQEIDLIKKILRVNADNRPSIAAILEHPYLKDVIDIHPQQKSSTTSRVGSSTQESLNHAQKMEKFQQNKTQNSMPISHQNIETQAKMQQKQPFKVEKHQKSQQFKYFVPQGVKPNNFAPIKPNGNASSGTGNSISGHQSYQNFTSQSGFGNQNTSIDSTTASYRQQMPMPSFLANQKAQTNPSSKVSNVGPITSSIGLNQQPKPAPIMQTMGTANTYQFSQNPSQWRKN